MLFKSKNVRIKIDIYGKHYETAYQSVEREYKKPVKVSKIANTSMDKAIQKNKDMESYGKADLSIFLNKEEPPKKKNYYY